MILSSRYFYITSFAAMIVVLPTAVSAQALTLPIPYVSQVPDGVWVSPWDEACEEASITMVDGFYRKQASIKASQAKKTMQKMIDWEIKNFPSKDDTDAEQTKILIQQHVPFQATVVRHPTIDDIKRELDEQRPVIIMVNMYELYQEPSQGDSYHVAVVSGYDEEKQEFIVHDPAREQTRYSYQTVMNALHDYELKTREASGPPTVLFTEPLASSGNAGVFSKLVAFFKRLFS